MSVSRADVLAMAGLAKLRLDEVEAERLRGDLNQILDHVDRLEGLAGVDEVAVPEAPSHGSSAAPPAEADFLVLSPQDMAPEWAEGHFLVPQPRGVDRESS